MDKLQLLVYDFTLHSVLTLVLCGGRWSGKPPSLWYSTKLEL